MHHHPSMQVDEDGDPLPAAAFTNLQALQLTQVRAAGALLMLKYALRQQGAEQQQQQQRMRAREHTRMLTHFHAHASRQ